MAWGMETLWRKIEENPAQGETFGHKNDLNGEKAGGLLLVVSFLLEGMEDPKMAELVDKLDEVPLKEDHPGRCIKIRAELKDPIRGQILALIRRYTDIFCMGSSRHVGRWLEGHAQVGNTPRFLTS